MNLIPIFVDVANGYNCAVEKVPRKIYNIDVSVTYKVNCNIVPPKYAPINKFSPNYFYFVEIPSKYFFIALMVTIIWHMKSSETSHPVGMTAHYTILLPTVTPATTEP